MRYFAIPTLLAKLLTSTRLALDVPLTNIFAWCDSTIVLHWLDRSSRRFKTFVGNRISAILDVLPPTKWSHVPTDCNPADCASWGLLPKEQLHHQLWWSVSDWLQTEPIQWPPQPSPLHSAYRSSRPLCAMSPVRSLQSGLRRGMVTMRS